MIPTRKKVTYEDFVKNKLRKAQPSGFTPTLPMNEKLFDWQKTIVAHAVKLGRCALFEDCGLGKAVQQMEWARQVCAKTGGKVLILAPIGVTNQTQEVEAPKFGYEVTRCKFGTDVKDGINITNYERLHLFDDIEFDGVVLDESSILKSFDGKTRKRLTERFASTPYRLCCTATPAPNDFTELGQHADFLGVCSPAQMLATYFINDTYDTGTWRVKGHAEESFWKWVSSWAVCLSKPSDIGFKDDGFDLPELSIEPIWVDVDEIAEVRSEGELFRVANTSATTINKEMRLSLQERCEVVKSIMCGNLNTQSPEGKNISAIQPKESGENHKAENQKKTALTCKDIITETKPDGTEEAGMNKTESTLKKGRSTPPMRRTGTKSSNEQKNGHQSEEIKKVKESEHTESQSVNLTQCSESKNTNVKSVDLQISQNQNFSQSLTTATKQALSEDYCAETATVESDTLRTPQDSCELRRYTSNEQWAVWVNLNDEQDCLESILDKDETVSIRGASSEAAKINGERRWRTGVKKTLVTKGSIFGYGMNFQHCHNLIVFPTYSHEDFYQIVRRFYRFGQKEMVKCFLILPRTAHAVLNALNRKKDQHELMQKMMRYTREAIGVEKVKDIKMNTKIETRTEGNWTMHLGDCVRVAKTFKDESIGFSVFSPPFADLFTYSEDVQDMGNCSSMDDFMVQFGYLIDELHRVMMPGREIAVHCCDLLATKWKDGAIEFKNFSDVIYQAFHKRGFLFHSRVCIWKSPVTEMQRTKAHGLLYKTLQKDSSNSRVGSADYLLVFRKRGENPVPIVHTPDDLPLDLWQEIASPVWMTVDQGNVLNGRNCKEQKDERHICPLQIDVINRALILWSMKDDLVFSPFAGIGSEGYCAVKMGRKFVGSELKQSYFEQACVNLNAAMEESKTLFALK